MNTRLSTEHVKNPDFAAAATELLQNARRLIAAGCFEQAHAALDLLIQPGPWNASGTPVMKELEELVPLACRLAGKPSPKVRYAQAMSMAQLAEWAEGRAQEVVGNLVVQTRFEAGKPVGENWSEAYLQSLPGIAGKAARESAFNDFLADAEFVLKKRLEKAGVKSPHGIHSMPMRSPWGLVMRAVYSYVASGPKVAPAAKATPTASIVHAVAAYMRRTGMRSNKAIEFIFLAATVLSLREGRTEDAVLAASALADSEWGPATLVQAAVWPPLAELLRSGRCAAAAGADRASAAEYLAALKRRPAAPNAPAAGPAKAAAPAPDEPVSDEPGWMESLILARPVIDQPARSAKRSGLSTEHIENPDIAKAAAELLQNARRLIVAGCFEQAHAALDLLIQPGPWKAGGQGRIATDLETLLPLVCHLTGRPSPKICDTGAKSVPELAEWAKELGEEVLNTLEMPIRNQLKPAGENWSEVYLQSLPDIADKRARQQAFGSFAVDAEFVLKSRLLNGRAKLPHFVEPGEGDGLSANLLTSLLTSMFQPPEVADAAKDIPTASIVRAAAAYRRRTDTPSGYVEDFIFHAATVLALREGRLDEAAFAAGSLVRSELGLAALVQSAVWPPLADLLRSGRCAEAIGADRASAGEYLAALKRRPASLAGPAAAAPVKSSAGPCSFDALRAALAATPLAGREIIEIPVLDTDERAYAIVTDPREMEAMWKAARGLLETTQRWPVLVALWGGGDEDLRDGELFSRFEYKEAPHAGDVSPRAILAAADTADVAKFLRERMQDNAYNEPIYDAMDSELESSTWHAGAAPAPQEAMKARIGGKLISTRYELDRWLLDWERAHAKPINLDEVRQDWFEPDSVVLLFLPTPNPWDTLAYLHFFGSSYHGVENYIALGRQWQQRYGAELVAHFGTMLQCYVTRPPATDADAWQLAVEHDIAASCTLPQLGIALRHHAMGLIGYDRWFLHERP